MNWEKWCLRIGTGAIVFALFFRLGCNNAMGTVITTLSTREAGGLMLFLETGRVLPPVVEAPTATQTPTPEIATGIPETTQEQKEEITQALFVPADVKLVEVNRRCSYTADLPTLLAKPLSWDLTQEKPTVLIVHSHGTESYTKTEDYKESSAYRTRDKSYNMVSVGAALAKILEAGGIQVIHDTACHDDPSYNAAYTSSRKSVKSYLEKYPSIALVLDLHRDSVENKKGQQVRFTVNTDGKTAARLMLVVGTDDNGLSHPQWPENMALAVKLHALLEKNTPGICRPISFRKQRFNQDLSTGAILIEVGSAGNTRQEALAATELLGQAIIELARGTA